MNVSYDSELRAIAHKNTLKARAETEQFCPLIKQLCRTDCVCFNQAYVVNLKDKFWVRGFYCDNRMLSNE